MINRRTLLGSALAAPFLSLLPRQARAAQWPAAGPIRLVVAQGGGGNADVVARILVEALEPVLGQRIVVENNGTASGMRATEDVSKAEPDGYTLLVGTSSQLVHNIALFDPLPVDIESTLRGVAMINEVPMVMCVPKDSPDTDLAGLTERVLADPAAFQYGSGPTGTTTHITGAFFLQRIGARTWSISLSAQLRRPLVDLIAGASELRLRSVLTAIGQVQGRCRASARVSAPVRLPALAEVRPWRKRGCPASSARPGTPSRRRRTRHRKSSIPSTR